MTYVLPLQNLESTVRLAWIFCWTSWKSRQPWPSLALVVRRKIYASSSGHCYCVFPDQWQNCDCEFFGYGANFCRGKLDCLFVVYRVREACLRRTRNLPFSIWHQWTSPQLRGTPFKTLESTILTEVQGHVDDNRRRHTSKLFHCRKRSYAEVVHSCCSKFLWLSCFNRCMSVGLAGSLDFCSTWAGRILSSPVTSSLSSKTSTRLCSAH